MPRDAEYLLDIVDLSIVWDTVHEKLPALVAELEKIVPAENG